MTRRDFLRWIVLLSAMGALQRIVRKPAVADAEEALPVTIPFAVPFVIGKKAPSYRIYLPTIRRD